MRKVIAAHLCFIMISGAFFYVKPDGPNLVWNMFLALLALDFAYASYMMVKKPLLSWLAMLFWLIFYPNSFYMLTDIIYFTWVRDILWQRYALANFAVFTSAILLGLISGVVSVQVVLERLKVKSRWWRLGFIIALSGLSSIAIYIGRYARLNSWDIFLQPKRVLMEILSVLQGKDLGFVLIFLFIQVMTLLLLDKDDF